MTTTTTTTRPGITHPAWCDPDQCSEDRTRGQLCAVNHRSPLSELTLTTPGAENSTLRIRTWLTQFDDYDEATVTRSAAVPFLDADGDADIPPDQLEAAGRWIIARAEEWREAIDDPEAVLAAAPPVECFPWCVDGDGHGDELFADDQSCTTAEHRVTLSQHDDIEMNDGTWQADYAAVSAAAYADGHMAPEIRLGQGEEAPMRLTASEARQVAAALIATADLLDGAR